jgi:type IV pilus assembly protein PilC
MPRYFYKAKDKSLKFIQGTIEAENENTAISRLNAFGIYPISLSESSLARAVEPSSVLRKVPARSLALMSRQLADLLSGGLPLIKALSVLSSQTENRNLKATILNLEIALRDGASFADALTKHPDIFPPIYVSLVRVGEAGGGLELVLNRLAELTEAEAELKSRAFLALVYPCVVFLFGIIAILVLLTFVLPKLSILFAETGGVLPLPTRITIAISDSLSKWWLAWVLFIGAIVIFLRYAIRSVAVRNLLDGVLLKIPGIGLLIRKYQTTQFTRSLGVMVGQGVPVLQALEVSGSTVANGILNRAIQRTIDEVKQGKGLSSALSASGEFPVFVSNMIAVGEESGKLNEALIKVSTSYERETDHALRALTTVLEPALIVAVGLVVMFIVISMLLPIFQLGFSAQ